MNVNLKFNAVKVLMSSNSLALCFFGVGIVGKRADRSAELRYCAVKICGPSAVIAIVCSYWADSLPSSVRAVQPSESMTSS